MADECTKCGNSEGDTQYIAARGTEFLLVTRHNCMCCGTVFSESKISADQYAILDELGFEHIG